MGKKKKRKTLSNGQGTSIGQRKAIIAANLRELREKPAAPAKLATSTDHSEIRVRSVVQGGAPGLGKKR